MSEKVGNHDSISTLFLVGLSFAICVESIRLGAGSFSNPGPELFPLYTVSCVNHLRVK